MTRYRKIPVEVEAFRFNDDILWGSLLLWANHLVRLDKGDWKTPTQYFIYDRLHDTWVQFEEGDYLVKGVQGEYYPVKADIFQATYEAVEEDSWGF